MDSFNTYVIYNTLKEKKNLTKDMKKHAYPPTKKKKAY